MIMVRSGCPPHLDRNRPDLVDDELDVCQTNIRIVRQHEATHVDRISDRERMCAVALSPEWLTAHAAAAERSSLDRVIAKDLRDAVPVILTRRQSDKRDAAR